LKGAEHVASLAGQGKTLRELREAVVEALMGFEGRIVVFLDDLDRLTDSEIREIVRLVKLVGDLPRVSMVRNRPPACPRRGRAPEAPLGSGPKRTPRCSPLFAQRLRSHSRSYEAWASRISRCFLE
jgi:hypothetical protein